MLRELDRQINLLAESAARKLTRRHALTKGVKTSFAVMAGLAGGVGLAIKEAEATCTCDWAQGRRCSQSSCPHLAVVPRITRYAPLPIGAMDGAGTRAGTGSPAPDLAQDMVTRYAPTVRPTSGSAITCAPACLTASVATRCRTRSPS
jgi:hypothetical protein